MPTKQQRVIAELFEEYRARPSTGGIVVFGSAAAGQERPDSDVDVEIITTRNARYKLLQGQRRHGIKIDLEIISSADFNRWITQYPYLWYDYLQRHKILLDKNKNVERAVQSLKDYFKANPEATTFWRKKLSAMRKAKQQQKSPESCYRVYDEAERLFSKTKTVTRDFFRD